EMQDARSSSGLVQVNPNLAKIIAKYAALDDQLSGFCRRMQEKLEAGNAEGIFPCQQSQVHNFLATLPSLDKKISEELKVIAVTGRRALLALNSFIFGQTLLEDELFFRSKTLFTVTGQRDNDVAVRRSGPQLRVAAACKVDTTIKELLDPNQRTLTAQKHQAPSTTSLMLVHFFAPEVERRLAEAELSYVRSLAMQSRLVLLCQHLRGKRDEVAEIVQSPEVNGESKLSRHILCYFTQWQWDGLSNARPQLEATLDNELKIRSTRLAKAVTKELKVPFQTEYQQLSRNIANKQRRNPNEYRKDFANLRSMAARLGSEFQRLSDRLVREVSENVAQHLRRAAELKGSSENKVEIAFLEVVANEIREWNTRTEVLNKADEVVQRDKFVRQHEFQRLQLSGTPSRASQKTWCGDVCAPGVWKLSQRGIAAPLWVPLAAITMAIIVPVIGAQKSEQSDEKFKKELRGLAQDFLDRLDSQLIRTQFFDRVKHRLDDEAKQLREFMECFCILPASYESSQNARHTDESLTESLVILEQQLQEIQGHLMMLQLEKLNCEVLSKEECEKYGIDIDVTSTEQLGKELVSRKPIYEVLPKGAERPLVLKLAPGKGSMSHRLLLEIDILKTVSSEMQNNIIPWLGTVYFPRLQLVGFLTLKYDCDLWQFLGRFGRMAIPARNEIGSQSRGSAFARLPRPVQPDLLRRLPAAQPADPAHRDLKLENVLIEVQKDTEPLRIVAKLCDFGLAKHESEMSGSTFGGTNGYMAPEVLHNRPAYSNKSDIYALGVIAWECFFGKRAREYESDLRMCKTGDTVAWDYLVQTMTEPRAMDRPLIEQCLMLLRELDKKPSDQGSPLLAGLTQQVPFGSQTQSVPSLKESIVALTKG
uniref:Protein kinase domain-containing protein n=1 Tax=Macrostomum lignano TaxID=282301 RepID=A0A1I8JS77_9PLAT